MLLQLVPSPAPLTLACKLFVFTGNPPFLCLDSLSVGSAYDRTALYVPPHPRGCLHAPTGDRVIARLNMLVLGQWRVVLVFFAIGDHFFQNGAGDVRQRDGVLVVLTQVCSGHDKIHEQMLCLASHVFVSLLASCLYPARSLHCTALQITNLIKPCLVLVSSSFAPCRRQRHQTMSFYFIFLSVFSLHFSFTYSFPCLVSSLSCQSGFFLISCRKIPSSLQKPVQFRFAQLIAVQNKVRAV